ncbi:MAG: hypothetical protein EA417_12020 [Gammaproteobacteria bacterium]|nr:MAG: hypothetical protein EA417_12020 [Gammaproteobacteria bacterium]
MNGQRRSTRERPRNLKVKRTIGLSHNDIDTQKASQMVRRLVEKTKAQYRECKDEPGRLRLYYIKPYPRDRVGKVKVTAKRPRKEWTLVTHVDINRRWSEEELERFLYMAICRVPILRGPIEQ